MCLPPLGTQDGSAGRFVKGRVGVTSDTIRTAPGPKTQDPRPQETQGKATPRQVPSTAPSICSKIGKLGRLAPPSRLRALPACPPSCSSRSSPTLSSRFGALALGSGGMAPHSWTSLGHFGPGISRSSAWQTVVPRLRLRPSKSYLAKIPNEKRHRLVADRA